MGKYGDWFVMLVAGALILLWLYRIFYRWLHSPAGSRVIVLGEGLELDADDEYVRFLEAEGYTVISGKHRIPICIELDGDALQSRLYIDYVAEKDGRMYIVKTARDRMPMDWSGSGVRDRLLVYSLLIPQSSGILFADCKARQIRTILFQVGEQ